jgi:hypothetical protein
MLIPAKHRKNHGRNEINKEGNFPPAAHTTDIKPAEGEYILLKDAADAND